MNEILLSWKAPAHPHHQRTKRWYATAALCAGLLIAYAILSQAWTFASILVLTCIVFLAFHKSPPKMHDVALMTEGMKWNKRLIPWEECGGFWLLEGPEYVELHIEKKGKSTSNIRIQTGSMDPKEIFDVLNARIPYIQGKRENLFDAISRICQL